MQFLGCFIIFTVVMRYIIMLIASFFGSLTIGISQSDISGNALHSFIVSMTLISLIKN